MSYFEDGYNYHARIRRDDGGFNATIPTGKVKEPKNLDPVKEWEKVKDAWRGDQQAWERYSGLKLPDVD